jgi:outer membrane lipoprotein carrier protein
MTLFAASVVLLALVSASEPPKVDDVVARVQERLDATSSFTAKVEQELEVASLGRTLKATGTVAFKRPGHMRWELKNDDPQVIVADGRTLWFYQPKEQQVLKAPFQSAFRSTTPVSFLTGVGRIRDDFAVTLVDATDSAIHLDLRPRRGEGELGKLRLQIEPTTYDIVGADVTDPLGNVTRLRFSEMRRNVELAESLFKFEVPPGVDVIEAPIGR